MSKQLKITILNPKPGTPTCLDAKRALKLVSKGKARLTVDSKLEFVYLDDTRVRADAMARRVRLKHSGRFEVQREFSGYDAFPDRAVFPPSPSVLDRMRGFRGPLRPPVQQQQQPSGVQA